MKLIFRLILFFIICIFIISVIVTISIKTYFSNDIKATAPPCYDFYYEIIESPPIVTSPGVSDNLGWVFQNDISKYVTSHGTHRKDKVYLTIGIPSIKRIVKSVYVVETLQHLSSKISAEDKQAITVVVFLCDNDAAYNNLVKEELSKYFKEDLQQGFIQIITVHSHYYPQIASAKRTFDDPFYRIKWRTKQVFDFNVLFRYCSQLSEYHMQIEDDIKISGNFLAQVKSYISSVTLALDMHASSDTFQKLSNSPQEDIITNLRSHFHSGKRWTLLDFSTLGFIGKLFQSGRMNQMATFFSMFYDEQPIDWLVVYFVFVSGQNQVHQHTPSLFQHFGLKSSLDTIKDNGLKDRRFEANYSSKVTALRSQNSIPALIFSSIAPVENFPAFSQTFLLQGISNNKHDRFHITSHDHSSPNNFYIANPHFLYAASQLLPSDHIDVVFLAPANITTITMETGVDGVSCHNDLVLHAGRRVQKVPKQASDPTAPPAAAAFELACTELQALANVSQCITTLNVSLRDVACLSLSLHSPPNSSITFFNYIHVSGA